MAEKQLMYVIGWALGPQQARQKVALRNGTVFSPQNKRSHYFLSQVRPWGPKKPEKN